MFIKHLLTGLARLCQLLSLVLATIALNIKLYHRFSVTLTAYVLTKTTTK